MNTFVSKLNKFHITISAVFLAIFLISVVIQVVTRLMGISVAWTQDISVYAFIWSVFLGGSAMIYPMKHFAFTSLVDTLKSKKSKQIVNLIIYIVMLIFTINMFFYGIIITQKFWNYRCVNLLALKRGYTWICIPISAALGIIYLVNHIYYGFKRLTKGALV